MLYFLLKEAIASAGKRRSAPRYEVDSGAYVYGYSIDVFVTNGHGHYAIFYDGPVHGEGNTAHDIEVDKTLTNSGINVIRVREPKSSHYAEDNVATINLPDRFTCLQHEEQVAIVEHILQIMKIDTAISAEQFDWKTISYNAHRESTTAAKVARTIGRIIELTILHGNRVNRNDECVRLKKALRSHRGRNNLLKEHCCILASAEKIACPNNHFFADWLEQYEQQDASDL